MSRCYKCMKEYGDSYDMCPYCGYEKGTPAKELYFLTPGSVVANRYEIGVSIGSGGFGIMYKAWDSVLEKTVAVKEYYPIGLVNRAPGQKHITIYSGHGRKEFEHGKMRFLEEAKNMAKFDNHPNIVAVYDFFEENNTAYFVMEFLEGKDYKQYIEQQGGAVSLEYAVEITKVVLRALAEVHKHGIVHRDISPDNIFICNDGKIKLIDFGTARFSSKEEEILRSVEVKWEYAPPEQYQKKSKQGPWTDVYAVGAMLYKAVTNVELQSSQDRVEDDKLVDPIKLCSDMTENMNSIILRAMALQPELRFQTVEEFLEAIETKGKIRNAKKELRFRKVRRVVSIAVISIIVGVGALICNQVVEQRKADAAVLEEATITIWIPGDDTENQTVYEAALAEFVQDYPQVTLQITYIDAENYESTLWNALAQNELPVLFESSCIDIGDTEQVATVSDVFKFINTQDYFFLDKYKKYFPEAKQMPLGFTVPMIYRNQILDTDSTENALFASEDYLLTRENYFTYSNVFGEGTKIKDFAKLPEALTDTFESENCRDAIERFMNNEATCLLADTSANNTIEKSMAGYYLASIVDDKGAVGRFVDCYSISAEASKEEKAAAVQVLVYLLSDTAQDARYVQAGDYLPLNRTMLNTYVNVNTAFEGLQNSVSDMLMPGEYQRKADELVNNIMQ